MIRNADNEVKLLFIEEQLSLYGEWLCDVFIEAMENNQNIFTGDLLDSVNYAAFKERSNPGLRFTFFDYGRFIDITAYKKNRSSINPMEIVWGEKTNRQRRKKPAKWYAKNMYSGFYRLVSSIMYGLSEAEIARLKGIIENRKNSKI